MHIPVLDSLPQVARDALSIWQAGVDAVRADRVVEQQVHWDGRWLTIAEEAWDLQGIERLIVVGAGKASAGMLAGLVRALDQSRHPYPMLCGWINVPQGAAALVDQSLPHLTICEARPQGMNEPTPLAVEGTRQILNWVREAGRNDFVICFLSGGGSALLCAPVDGLSLQDKVLMTRALSASGANIEQLNAVRRCLSQVKGGGLARACRSTSLVTCILSDVLGDPLEFIGSGPTVLHPSPDPAQALEVLSRFVPGQFQGIESLLEQQQRHSNAVGASRVALNRSEIELHPLILANNATAVDAAGQRAVELGYRYWMKSERASEGNAATVGEGFAKQLAATLNDPQVDCLISGGEPAVALPPPQQRGRGGRNQQLVLSLLNWFQKNGGWPSRAEIAFVSGGTDGEDGPTDAAGAYVDAEIAARAIEQGLDLEMYLNRCDAYSFFEQVGGLIKTGLTHTNVCDLRVGLVRWNGVGKMERL